jgi:competence protein ComEC
LLGLAHAVASLPHAVMAMPTIGSGAFAFAMVGLLWLMLWRGALRLAGLPMAALGLGAIALTPAPDVLVTADGRHVALRTVGGGYALLRDRAGDYVRDTLAEAAGQTGAFTALATLDSARCSPDLCVVDMAAGEGRPMRLLATRSSLHLPWAALVAACAGADIVVSDRPLPRGCVPRWLKLDARVLSPTGGALVFLDRRRLVAGRDPRDAHPWVRTRVARRHVPR